MINLSAYQSDCFEFYENVLSKKRSRELRDRMAVLKETMESLFTGYQTKHNSNQTELITAFGFNEEPKSDLLSLYAYRLGIIQELKTAIITNDQGRVLNTCQNCTINSVNSLDHLIPKEDFPEYSVNPINLFPSCTECNSYKGRVWQENGERLFLNLYLDRLPSNQYLKVSNDFSNGNVYSTFYLENPGFDDATYNRILSHYTRLHLLSRFSTSTHDVVTELVNSVQSNIDTMSRDEIRGSVTRTEERNKISFGHNFWESVLKISLINDDRFFDLV